MKLTKKCISQILALSFGLAAFHSHAEDYDIPRVDPQGDKSFYVALATEMKEKGDSWDAILLDLVRNGLTLADAAYVSSLLDPKQGHDIYDVAIELLPSLPKWVCDPDGMLEEEYTVDDEPDTNRVCNDSPELTSCITLVRDAAIIGSGRLDLFPAAGGCTSTEPVETVVPNTGRGPVSPN